MSRGSWACFQGSALVLAGRCPFPSLLPSDPLATRHPASVPSPEYTVYHIHTHQPHWLGYARILRTADPTVREGTRRGIYPLPEPCPSLRAAFLPLCSISTMQNWATASPLPRYSGSPPSSTMDRFSSIHSANPAPFRLVTDACPLLPRALQAFGTQRAWKALRKLESERSAGTQGADAEWKLRHPWVWGSGSRGQILAGMDNAKLCVGSESSIFPR